MNLAVAIIALQDSQVLLIRNAKRNGSCEIPGGSVLHGETIFSAAARELFEETGLRAKPDDFVLFDEKDVQGWHVCLMRVLRWSGTLRAGDDCEEAFWGPPDLILEGQRAEDYEIVMRAMHQHKAAYGR